MIMAALPVFGGSTSQRKVTAIANATITAAAIMEAPTLMGGRDYHGEGGLGQ